MGIVVDCGVLLSWLSQGGRHFHIRKNKRLSALGPWKDLIQESLCKVILKGKGKKKDPRAAFRMATETHPIRPLFILV